MHEASGAGSQGIDTVGIPSMLATQAIIPVSAGLLYIVNDAFSPVDSYLLISY